ncbi:MAG: hypothetical protein EBT45_06080 [Alphaproteobacteria bacterium]|nr:hypothetical protein [Alphaproteobacteria bacterium]
MKSFRYFLFSAESTVGDQLAKSRGKVREIRTSVDIFAFGSTRAICSWVKISNYVIEFLCFCITYTKILIKKK